MLHPYTPEKTSNPIGKVMIGDTLKVYCPNCASLLDYPSPTRYPYLYQCDCERVLTCHPLPNSGYDGIDTIKRTDSNIGTYNAHTAEIYPLYNGVYNIVHITYTPKLKLSHTVVLADHQLDRIFEIDKPDYTRDFKSKEANKAIKLLQDLPLELLITIAMPNIKERNEVIKNITSQIWK